MEEFMTTGTSTWEDTENIETMRKQNRLGGYWKYRNYEKKGTKGLEDTENIETMRKQEQVLGRYWKYRNYEKKKEQRAWKILKI